jgi:Spy/CpxP family protein refolding chaperone
MTRKSLIAITFASLLLGSFAVAQQPDATPPPPPDHPGQSHKTFQHVITMDDAHSRLRIGPPGIWWKNPDLVQKLNITPDQQKRMDDIFQQSRLQLIDLKAEVERQEVLLEPMLAANPPDTNKVLAQIDRAAQARAELEKANARMLLGIRTVLTPDQWTKLQAEERGNRRMMFRDRQRPDGPPTPGVPGNPMGPQSQLTLPALPSLDALLEPDDPFDLNF